MSVAQSHEPTIAATDRKVETQVCHRGRVCHGSVADWRARGRVVARSGGRERVGGSVEEWARARMSRGESRSGGRVADRLGASRGECRGVMSEGLRVVGSAVEWRAGAYVRGECRGVVGDRARWWSGACVCVVGRCGECRGEVLAWKYCGRVAMGEGI